MSAVFFARANRARRERMVRLRPKLRREVPVRGKVGFRSPRTTTSAQSFPTPSTTSRARPTIMRLWQVNTLPLPPINYFNPSPSSGRTDRGHPPDYEALSPSRRPKTQESGRERNRVQFQGWNTWREMDERLGGRGIPTFLHKTTCIRRATEGCCPSRPALATTRISRSRAEQ